MTVDYKNTILLPKTLFPMRPDLKTEKLLVETWEKQGVYDTIRSRMRGKTKKVVHDGPPYANGNIHLGHAVNKILKDITVRYLTQSGYDSPFIPGWDCHGLPIEHNVVKEFAQTGATPSPQTITEQCHRDASIWVSVQRQQFSRLGILADWHAPYLTTSPSYIQKVTNTFKNLTRNNFITRDLRPVWWCVKDETALADAELDYREMRTFAYFVYFELAAPLIDVPSRPRQVFIAWTTTPWTLPANVRLAVNPDIKYAAVKFKKDGRDILAIVAKDLVVSVMKESEIQEYSILKEIAGRNLEGIKYIHPFRRNKTLNVVCAKFVSDKTGSGVVHIAPGHGTDDFNLCLDLGVPASEMGSQVDHQGRFIEGTHHSLDGKKIAESIPDIISELYRFNLIYARQNYTHSYPHCWRCKSPVIMRTVPQWFIDLNHKDLRKNTIASLDNATWIPAVSKSRIKSMLEDRPSWCISRQRHWGIPIPAVKCAKCEHRSLSVFFPELNFVCTKCKNKYCIPETDILDVWFESGVSHQILDTDASEIIAIEGSDQHRGWFQSSFLLSLANRSQAPFTKVMTHGFVVDSNGKKLSKSDGAASAHEFVDKYGAEVLRFFIAMTDCTTDIRFGDHAINDARQMYFKYRNTLRYLLGNLRDYEEGIPEQVETKDMDEIDKYILCKYETVAETCIQHYEQFEFHKIVHLVMNFCSIDLSTFYFEILKDRLYNDAINSSRRKSALFTMHYILRGMACLMNPILPFSSDEVLLTLIPKNYVHGLLPLCSTRTINFSQEEEEKWSKLRELRKEIFKKLEDLRADHTIGKNEEASVQISPHNEFSKSFLEDNKDTIKTITLVSRIEITDDIEPISARKSIYGKCLRCWRHESEVSQSEKSLCNRCTAIIASSEKH